MVISAPESSPTPPDGAGKAKHLGPRGGGEQKQQGKDQSDHAASLPEQTPVHNGKDRP